MFSITCAQKMAKIKTLPSELEAWEQRRKDESSKIQERRRHERSSRAIFPPGYGPAGRVPKYVKAHIGLLEKSPLARPVISPGRCIQPHSSACCRRPLSAASATTGSTHHTKPKKAAFSTRPNTAPDRRCPKGPWQQQQQQITRTPPSASSPVLLDRPARGAAAGRPTLEAGGRVRPATAPCVSSRRRDDFVDGAREEETRLVEQMARLSGVQRGGEFPTVAALKTAVALEALQAQLRECRASGLATNPAPGDGGGAGTGANQKRAASAPVLRSPSAADGTQAAPRDRRTSERRRRRAREHQRAPKPWDNRSPFVAGSLSRSRSIRASGSPTSPAAPALRTLTRRDPVFGRATAPPPAPPPPPESPNIPRGEQHSQQGKTASSSSATTPASQETRVQACFRRLTVPTLVELSPPPQPTQARSSGPGGPRLSAGLEPGQKKQPALVQGGPPPPSAFAVQQRVRPEGRSGLGPPEADT